MDAKLDDNERTLDMPDRTALATGTRGIATFLTTALLYGCGGGDSDTTAVDPPSTLEIADDELVVDSDTDVTPLDSASVLARVQNRRDDESFDFWGCIERDAGDSPVPYNYEFSGRSGTRTPPSEDDPILEFTVEETAPGTLLLDYAAIGEQEELSDFRFDGSDEYVMSSSSLGTLDCFLGSGTFFTGDDEALALFRMLVNGRDDAGPLDAWYCGEPLSGNDFTMFSGGSVGRYAYGHTTALDFADEIFLDPGEPGSVVLTLADDPNVIIDTLRSIEFAGPDAFTTESEQFGSSVLRCDRSSVVPVGDRAR